MVQNEKEIIPDRQFRLKEFVKFVSSINPKKKIFLIGMLFTLLTSGAALVVPQLTKNLVDGSRISEMNISLLFMLVLAFVAQLAFGALGSYLLRYSGEHTVKRLREKLWDHLITLPVTYYDNHKSGETSSRLVNDTTVIKELMTSHFPNFIAGGIQLIGSMIILLIMDWKMAGLMFLAVPVIGLIMVPIGRMMSKIGRELQTATAAFNADASEKLSEIRLIKSSNGERFEQQSGRNLIMNVFKLGLKDAKVEAMLQPIMMTAMIGLFVVVLGYGAVRVQEGSLTSGQFVAFLLYLFNIMMPVGSFAIFFSQLQKAMGATERVVQLMEMHAEQLTHGVIQDVSGKTIRFDKVSFHYEANRPVLQDVSFEARENSVVAFVGPSGGGKSTIFSLLEKFYEPVDGKISIGDTNISDVALHSWRSQIGFVSQDSAVFAGTIRDNLQYGLDRILSDEDLWHGLSLAYASSFVQNFPEQLDTEIGERGVKLSGGQKQRIAIARAFLRDPKILMLDEATASLDSQSEEQVQRALNQLMQGRTTLVIAHRLSTIVDADEIHFVEQGTITGSGTHQELIQSHVLYRDYVKEQIVS